MRNAGCASNTRGNDRFKNLAQRNQIVFGHPLDELQYIAVAQGAAIDRFEDFFQQRWGRVDNLDGNAIAHHRTIGFPQWYSNSHSSMDGSCQSIRDAIMKRTVGGFGKNNGSRQTFVTSIDFPRRRSCGKSSGCLESDMGKIRCAVAMRDTRVPSGLRRY